MIYLRLSAFVAALSFYAIPGPSFAQALPRIEMTERFRIESPTEQNPYDPWSAAFVSGDVLVVPMQDLRTERFEGHLFDVNNGQQLGLIGSPNSANGDFFAKNVVANDRFAVIESSVTRNGYLYNQIRVYDLPALTLRYVIDVPESEDRLSFGAGTMAISGHRLAVTSAAPPGKSESGTVFMYDLNNGEELFRIQDPAARSGFFSVFQFYDDYFPGGIAMTETHLAITAHEPATGTARVHLFDPMTGAHIRQVAEPAIVGGGRFGNDVALDENRLYVGASQRSSVRIGLNIYAENGEVYALDLSDDSVIYTLNDPMPVEPGTPDAAYAAATGAPVPFYGSKFGFDLQVVDGTLYAGMTDFSEPVALAGAVAVYGAETGEPIGLLQSSDPRPYSNFRAIDILPGGAVIGFTRAYKEPGEPARIEVLHPE